MAALPYEYVPLAPERPQIRLITLHPGQFSDDIVVSLEHHDFGGRPAYEALSYVWGCQQNREPVLIHNHSSAWSISVTWNLFSAAEMQRTLLATQNLCCALRHLRLPDKTRTLWVDALCIDQENLQERSTEVRRMGNIYSSAERVLVWLGPESDDSDLALQSIETLSAGIVLTDEFLPSDIVPGSQANSYMNIRYSGGTEFWETALKNFWQRPWFNRLWVRQEVHLARKKIAILGRRQISWENLGKTINLILYIARGSTKIWDYTELLPIQSLFVSIELGLFNLMRISSRTSYFNPRDIVYANLHMSPQIRSLNIEPDYRKSAAAVHKDLFSKYIHVYGDLDLLRLCDLRNLSPELPSFIPDLNIANLEHSIGGFANSGSTQSRIQVEDNRLTVHGLHVTTVSNVKGPVLFPHEKAAVVGICESWEPENLLTSAYPSGGSLLDAFSITLTGGIGSRLQIDSSVDQGSTEEFLADLWSGRDITSSHETPISLYIRRIANASRGGRVFLDTSEGYIGISSADVRMGDWICVLPGLPAPIVLRPLADDPALKQVVGFCYLHGVMFGEAILGSVPDDWKCSLGHNFQVQAGFEWGQNIYAAEKRTRHDPRLWPLKPEWEIHYCCDSTSCAGDCAEEGVNGVLNQPLFYNKITKEKTDRDPRLTVDALKEHGVPLQEIILV